MKRWTVGLLAVSMVAGGAWALRGRAPEERLARHFGGLCEIAAGNVKSPSRGVDRLFAWAAGHAPAMLHDFGELLVEIERIGDDGRHDRRAREAGRRMHAPLHACHADLERFADAVERDPEASAKLERGFDRLGRALQLIFDGGGGRDARTWLRSLARPYP